MSKLEILLVTCCLEESRYELLKQVINNIRVKCPIRWSADITVFDNASTWIGLGELKNTFHNVVRAGRNVGYWTAIDWWLESMKANPPEYTYIIESDMVHHDALAMDGCVRFMDEHDDIGAMRLQEYSVQDMHLYNKDAPVEGSRKALWQSHTNKVTGEGIRHEQVEGRFWRTNFLTQLPALNRYATMKEAFDYLHELKQFTELDFQRFYHDRYPQIALLDGGIFNCNLNPYGSGGVTGSWTDPNELRRLGYLGTRFASIVPRDQYTTQKV